MGRFNINLDPAEEGLFFKKKRAPLPDTGDNSPMKKEIPTFQTIEEGLNYALDQEKNGYAPKFHLQKYGDVIWHLYPYQHVPDNIEAMTQRTFSNVEGQLPIIEKRVNKPVNGKEDPPYQLADVEFDFLEKHPDKVFVTYYYWTEPIHDNTTIRRRISIEDCPYGIADRQNLKRYAK